MVNWKVNAKFLDDNYVDWNEAKGWYKKNNDRKLCLGVSGRLQEFLLDPVIFNFLNNDVEMSGSDNDFHHSLKFCTDVMTEE